MAVTKIRKVSSWTLLASIGISLIVVLIFFFGGSHMEGENKVYEFIGLLLSWTYILFIVCVIAALYFALMGIINAFKHDKKSALMSMGGFALLVIVLLISYAIGDTTKMANLNIDSAKFNTPHWLKISDMFLYSIYTMFTLVVVAIIWGTVRKTLAGKH